MMFWLSIHRSINRVLDISFEFDSSAVSDTSRHEITDLILSLKSTSDEVVSGFYRPCLTQYYLRRSILRLLKAD